MIAYAADPDEDEARRFVDHLLMARDPVILVRNARLADAAHELLVYADRLDIPVKINPSLPDDTLWVLDQAWFRKVLWAGCLPPIRWRESPRCLPMYLWPG